MASSRQTRRARLEEYLKQVRPTAITEAEWQDLLARLAPVSESYLRELLRASGLPLSPLVNGVRQDSFDALERTLLEIGREYAAAAASGDRARERRIRRLVIVAKDHAKLAARNPKTGPGKRAEKQEMALWLLTWLENPPVFETWLGLRKETLGREFRRPDEASSPG